MRFGSLSIQALLCVALASAPRLAAGQTETGATETTPPGQAVPTLPVAGEATATVTVETPAPPPAQTPGPPAQPAPAAWGATGPETETPWGTPQPAPAQPGWGEAQPAPAQPGWGTPAEGESTGWGAPTPAEGEQADWGDPNAAASWGEQPSFDLPEDQRVGSWPLLVSVGVGYGLASEGTVNMRASALTIQPTVFLGLLKHFGLHHGPSLSLPIGLPGSYDKWNRGRDAYDTISYGVSFAAVPGYQLVHFFRRDMFWGAGLGAPLLVASWQGSVKDEYAFTPGFEVDAQFGYKFLAGLGVYLRAVYDVFFGTYTLTTFGGELGICMYYDWFRPWEPPTMASGLEEGVLP